MKKQLNHNYYNIIKTFSILCYSDKIPYLVCFCHYFGNIATVKHEEKKILNSVLVDNVTVIKRVLLIILVSI